MADCRNDTTRKLYYYVSPGRKLNQFIYKIVPIRPDFATSWTAEEERTMTAHFEYLKGLLDQGRLVLAGPCTDAAFGIVIFEAGSLEEAREIAQNDPAVLTGVMNFEVHPFRISLLRKFI